MQLLEGDIKRPTLLIEYKLRGIFTPVLFTSPLNLKKKIKKNKISWEAASSGAFKFRIAAFQYYALCFNHDSVLQIGL